MRLKTHPIAASRETPSCDGIPVEVFFPEKAQGETFHAIQRMCADCPLVAECFEWALHHEEHGVWAGTSAEQRRRIRLERGIAFHAPEVYILPDARVA